MAQHRLRGFTLIELLVGIALLAVILRLAVPSFTTAIQNTRLRTAAESVLDGLQNARAEALRRNRNINFNLGTAGGWTMTCETEDAASACTGTLAERSVGSDSNAVVATEQRVASSGALASSPVFTNRLTFNGLGRTTAGSLPGGNVAWINITNPSGGECAPTGPMRCLRVVVSSGGQVRMCDPAATAGTPRAC